MKRKIIPTVFAINKKEFDERFGKLIGASKELQIDFMDGRFVRAKGIQLKNVPNLKRKGKFEAHLMVSNPEKWIEKLKLKGFSKVIFHVETMKNDKGIDEIIKKIKGLRLKCWIALNPGTSLKKIEEFLDRVDGVMFMGVNPGREKQKFVDGVYGKIKEFRKKNKRIKIQVDGGVSLKNIERLGKIGVDIVNSGSFVSGAKNPRKALMELRKKFR